LLKWSTGSAIFYIDHETGLSVLPVAVECKLGNLDILFTTLLDTTSTWSVIGGEPAEKIGDQLGEPFGSIGIDTRFGMIYGDFHRLDISLIAGPGCGEDLTIESTVVVSDEWEGPIVLGYKGFLERLRFALDPGRETIEQPIIYFGAIG